MLCLTQVLPEEHWSKSQFCKTALSLEISILALLCVPFFFKIYFRGCHTSEISFNGQNHFVFWLGF